MIKSFDNLNLGRFAEIQKIVKEGGEWQDVNLRIVSALSDISIEKLSTMPISEVSEIVNEARFLDKPIPEQKVAKKYKIGNMELIPCYDVAKFTTAQYVDFQELMKAPDDNQIGILACILVPKGKRYNIDYDIAEVRELIANNISVTTSNALFTFFIKRLHHSIVDTLHSSQEMIEKVQPRTTAEEEKKKNAQRTLREALRFFVSGGGSAA